MSQRPRRERVGVTAIMLIGTLHKQSHGYHPGRSDILRGAFDPTWDDGGAGRDPLRSGKVP